MEKGYGRMKLYREIHVRGNRRRERSACCTISRVVCLSPGDRLEAYLEVKSPEGREGDGSIPNWPLGFVFFSATLLLHLRLVLKLLLVIFEVHVRR